MITFEADVRIDRPIEEVFAYVSEPLNFPDWNSAVQAVRKSSAGANGTGSTYVMERELPSGRDAARRRRPRPQRLRRRSARAALA